MYRLFKDVERRGESFQGLVDFGEKLSEKNYTLSELGIPSRIFNYWKTEKVLPWYQPDVTARFDVLEAIWLLMLNDLRNIGLNIGALRQIVEEVFIKPYKENFAVKFLNEEIKRIEGTQGHDPRVVERLKAILKYEGHVELMRRELTPFSLIIRRYIAYRVEAGVVVVFENNNSDTSKQETQFRVKYYGEPSFEEDLSEIMFSSTYIHLPLKRFIQQLFELNDEKFINQSPFLRPEERRVLNDVREGLAEGLSVTFKNKRIKKYKVETSIEATVEQFVEFFLSEEGKKIKAFTVIKRKTDNILYVEGH